MYFSVYTLGCKLNQLESESIIDSFLKAGFQFIQPQLISKDNNKLSLIIINTCTVTSMADQKARRIIRKYLRELPGACILITGCYAQMEKEILEALDDAPLCEGKAACVSCSSISNFKKRLFVIPGERKDELLLLPFFLVKNKIDPKCPQVIMDLINSWFSGVIDSIPSSNGSFSFLPEKFSSHSRAFLKIQDGCDNSCAYCRVSQARGKSRSFPAGEALGALKKLEDKGFNEAVLTGVNISQYSDSGIDLGALIKYLLKNTGKIRLRLSSIEPDFLSPDFLEVFENPRLRPHLHISLQSGSEEIIGKMGRSYKINDIEKAVELFRNVREDPFLACDIIAGYPGESEGEFEKTYRLCEKLGFAWIHAFPFSPRPGTAAFGYSPKISERDAVRRVELLSTLARENRNKYINSWVGKEVETIAERVHNKNNTVMQGLSDNYLKLHLKGVYPEFAPGALLRCRIMENRFSILKQGNQIDAMAKIIR